MSSIQSFSFLTRNRAIDRVGVRSSHRPVSWVRSTGTMQRCTRANPRPAGRSIAVAAGASVHGTEPMNFILIPATRGRHSLRRRPRASQVGTLTTPHEPGSSQPGFGPPHDKSTWGWHQHQNVLLVMISGPMISTHTRNKQTETEGLAYHAPWISILWLNYNARTPWHHSLITHCHRDKPTKRSRTNER